MAELLVSQEDSGNAAGESEPASYRVQIPSAKSPDPAAVVEQEPAFLDPGLELKAFGRSCCLQSRRG